jgi:putative transposase
MPNCRRTRIAGGTYFFTVVTFRRLPLLASSSAISVLQNSLEAVKARHPFAVESMVIMPDHLHCIWTLPDGDHDFSTRWRLVKAGFSRACQGSPVERIPSPLLRKGEKGIWQQKFWEHCIRDDADFNAHCDYIHYNPVKHGLARSPSDWPHSTFGLFVRAGLYSCDWGDDIPPQVKAMDLE